MDRSRETATSAFWRTPRPPLRVLASGLVGALVGWLSEAASRRLLDLLHESLTRGGVPCPWLPEPTGGLLTWALVGGTLGVVHAVVAGRRAGREAARSSERREFAAQAGMEYEPVAPADLTQRLSSLLGIAPLPPAVREFTNVCRGRVGSSELIVGDLKCGQPGDESEAATEQTVAYVESGDLDLPWFALSPKGPTLRLLTSGMVGLPGVDLSDRPELLRHYHLTAPQAEEARRLFAGPVLAYFARSPGLEVRAAGKRLLLFRPGQVCSRGGLRGFREEASQILALLRGAAQSLATPPPTPGTQSTPAGAGSAVPPFGLYDALCRPWRIMSHDLEAFLAEAPPRRIPKPLLRLHIGYTRAGVTLFAVPSALLGLALGLWGDATDSRVIGWLWAVASVLVLIWVYRVYKRRDLDLLRYGVVTEGTIESVQQSGVSANGQPAYRLSVRFTARYGPGTLVCKAAGAKGVKAQWLSERGEPVRVLYDPLDPHLCCWVESLITLESG